MNQLHEFYSNPLDVTQFLDGDKAEFLMKDVLQKAFLFYNDKGISPIVKTEAHDIYLVDYYFLVNRLSEYVYQAFLTQSEPLANEAKKQIVNDFGLNGGYKVKRLLINLLDFKGILYSNNDKRWVYLMKRYRGAHNGNLFLISGVAIDGNFIKDKLEDGDRAKLETIANPNAYVLEASGSKAMIIQQSSSGNNFVFSFC